MSAQDAMTPEQRAWLRANQPGRRERVPSLSDMMQVFDVPVPVEAIYACTTITRREWEDMERERTHRALVERAAEAEAARHMGWAEEWEDRWDG